MGLSTKSLEIDFLSLSSSKCLQIDAISLRSLACNKWWGSKNKSAKVSAGNEG